MPDHAFPVAGRSELLLDSLGYVGVSSDRLDDWTSFGRDVAGMQPAESGRRSLALRMDDRSQRFLVCDDGGRGFYGFEVSDADALEQVARRLDEQQVPHLELDAPTRDHRRITRGIWFRDPEGNRIEVFHGPEVADRPFSPAGRWGASVPASSAWATWCCWPRTHSR